MDFPEYDEEARVMQEDNLIPLYLTQNWHIGLGWNSRIVWRKHELSSAVPLGLPPLLECT